jgi:hypothetical protein
MVFSSASSVRSVSDEQIALASPPVNEAGSTLAMRRSLDEVPAQGSSSLQSPTDRATAEDDSG